MVVVAAGVVVVAADEAVALVGKTGPLLLFLSFFFLSTRSPVLSEN